MPSPDRPEKPFWTTIILQDVPLFARFRALAACRGRYQQETHEVLALYLATTPEERAALAAMAKDVEEEPPDLTGLPHAKLWIADAGLYARFREEASRRGQSRREAAEEAMRCYVVRYRPKR